LTSSRSGLILPLVEDPYPSPPHPEEETAMPTIEHKGVKLAYEEKGSGSPTFLFVHGWTCDRSFFKSQADHFAGQHRTVSVDLRGHGESDQPAGAYPISAYADDLAHLIDTLKLGKVVAVGHSMGGITVLDLGASHPDKVAAIVMVDPAPFVLPPDLKSHVSDIVAAIEAGNQEPRRQFIANALFLPTSDKKLVDSVLKVMMAAPPAIAAAAMKGIVAFDGPGVARRCTVPALHLAANPPLNPPHLMSQWMPKVVNGWTVGAGHFNMMEAPDQVNSMIEGFMRHHV
jgi:pimeloyl-ACP methyl ester carboxylesterase